MAGIVHYSNFFRYMEAAEHEFFRSLGFSVVTRQVEPPVGWPRVRAVCDFTQPLRFEDEIEVHLLVSEKKSKSLSYQFRIRRLNDGPLEVARGALAVVCVTHGGDRMRATPFRGRSPTASKCRRRNCWREARPAARKFLAGFLDPRVFAVTVRARVCATQRAPIT